MGAKSKALELLPGTLDLLILKALSLEPLHGWAIAKRIQQVSQEVLQITKLLTVFETFDTEQDALKSFS